MASVKQIVPCLWFDSQAEEAAKFYVGILPDSRINTITRYGNAGKEIHGRDAGSVMTVEFELNGQPFTALNGGPHFKFNEAVSFQVMCRTQEEIDGYWEKLGAGGDPAAQQCGWLKDRYGVSWQVIPRRLEELCGDYSTEANRRAMNAMLAMGKIDVDALERAHAGDE